MNKLVGIMASLTALGVLTAARPAPPPPLALTNTTRLIQAQVEQDNNAINPTNCLWDVDDIVIWDGNNGTLDAGATVTVTDCLMADAFHLQGITVTSPSPDLETRTWRILRDDANAGGTPYGWRGCVTTPGYQTAGPWQQPVAGSTGDAVPTTITVTIRNLGAAVVPDRRHYAVQPRAELNVSDTTLADDRLCPSGFPISVTGTMVGTDPAYYYSNAELLP